MKTNFYIKNSKEGILACRMIGYDPTIVDGLIYICSSIGENSAMIIEGYLNSVLKGSEKLIITTEKLSAKEYGKAIDKQVEQYREYSNNFFKRIYG